MCNKERKKPAAWRDTWHQEKTPNHQHFNSDRFSTKTLCSYRSNLLHRSHQKCSKMYAAHFIWNYFHECFCFRCTVLGVHNCAHGTWKVLLKWEKEVDELTTGHQREPNPHFLRCTSDDAPAGARFTTRTLMYKKVDRGMVTAVARMVEHHKLNAKDVGLAS